MSAILWLSSLNVTTDVKGWRRSSAEDEHGRLFLFNYSICVHVSVNSSVRCMCLTSYGFDSPARWGSCGAGCKHQAAHWESLEASRHPTQVPPRPRLLPPPPPESPVTQASVKVIFHSLCSKLSISLRSAFLPFSCNSITRLHLTAGCTWAIISRNLIIDKNTGAVVV